MKAFKLSFIIVALSSISAFAEGPYDNVKLNVDCLSSREDSLTKRLHVSGTITIGKLRGSPFNQVADAQAVMELKLIFEGRTVYETKGKELFSGSYRFGEGASEDSEYDELTFVKDNIRVEFSFRSNVVTVKRDGAEFFTKCQIR